MTKIKTQTRLYSLITRAYDALINIPEDRLPDTPTIIQQELKNMVDSINQLTSQSGETKEQEKIGTQPMNIERRKAIAEAISHIEEAKSILETAASEERESYDSLSSEKQSSDQGVAIEAAASSLEDAQDVCDSLITRLNDASV